MLTSDQIIEKIKNPVSGDELQAGIDLQNVHKVHITGEGWEAKLNQLVGFESESDWDVRKQLTGPGTMKLAALILDNLNRWVTNQGTVKIIRFKQQEEQEPKFKEVLDQVWRGKPLEDFIRTFYKEAIYQEMSGFLLVTKPQINEIEGTQIREGIATPYDGKSALMPYLIFIAAEDVKDFYGVGDELEYLIFKIGEDEDSNPIYRVIDKDQDLIVSEENEKLTILIEKVNEVGYVPAIQVTNIAKKLVDDLTKTSPIDHVIPALNRYMQKDSDLIMQMVRHMYPKLAIVTTACKQCDGQGWDFDIDPKVRCTDCNGSGKTIPLSRDGVLGIPQYLDPDLSPYPGSPASYITPDNDSLRTAIDDLKDLYKEILYSATGDKNLIVEGLDTATENLINFKGLEDRIAEIVEMVESREEFIITTVGKMHRDFSEAIETVSVRYGRRMAIRGENEIMAEITAAKKAGMPISHIEALQRELIYAKYKNNKVELERHLLLADLEPLNGYTVEEFGEMVGFVSAEDMKIKFNFNRIIDIFEAEKGPITEFKNSLEWKKRVVAIYNELKTISNEILPVERPTEPDRGKILDGSEKK